MVSPVDSGTRAFDAPHSAEQTGTLAQAAQALMDGSRQMGVLNAERLAQGLAQVAARDPGHAAKLRAEIEPQLAGTDRERLARELSTAPSQQAIGGANSGETPANPSQTPRSAGSLFGRDAAMEQAQWFSHLSDRAWNAADAIRSDPSQPNSVRDLVSLSQPFMAVGLGALGMVNDLATLVKDPSLLVEPLMHPADTAKAVGKGLIDFIANPNPFRQGQTMLTNFADPGMLGAHLAVSSSRLGSAASGLISSAADVDKSWRADLARSFGNVLDGGSFLPGDAGKGAGLLFPSFKTSLYAVPPKVNGLELQRLETTAADIIAAELRGSVNRVFPGRLREKTLAEILEGARNGDKACQTARKLLTDGRFLK